MDGKINVELDGVPETMLWPLWNRAAEMRRSKALINDPMSAELAERIDYDFRRSFGKPIAYHPIRARVGDDLIRDYIARTENPVVIALGDGLDTQFWRINDNTVDWVSVDVPQAILVRRNLLPSAANLRSVACSALDYAWMDEVADDAAPFISAAGLLMYFDQEAVEDLLNEIAARFRHAEIYFDTITPSVSAKTMGGIKVTDHYTAPPMPWGITFDDLPDFFATLQGWKTVTVQTYADPFPARMRPYNWLRHIGPIRRAFAGCLVHAVRDRERLNSAGVGETLLVQ